MENSHTEMEQPTQRWWSRPHVGGERAQRRCEREKLLLGRDFPKHLVTYFWIDCSRGSSSTNGYSWLNLKKSNSSASLLPKLLSLISILSKRYKPPKLTETFPVKLFTSTSKNCSSEALDNEVGRDRQIGLKKFEAIGDGEGWGISLWEDFH